MQTRVTPARAKSSCAVPACGHHELAAWPQRAVLVRLGAQVQEVLRRTRLRDAYRVTATRHSCRWLLAVRPVASQPLNELADGLSNQHRVVVVNMVAGLLGDDLDAAFG